MGGAGERWDWVILGLGLGLGLEFWFGLVCLFVSLGALAGGDMFAWISHVDRRQADGRAGGGVYTWVLLWNIYCSGCFPRSYILHLLVPMQTGNRCQL
jgi:hypothetical protein